MGPDEVVIRYSPRQIADIYAAIQNRKMKEANLEYNILRFAIGAAFADDPPEKIIELKQNDSQNKSGQQDFASIGLANESKQMMQNPNVEVFDSTEEGGED